MPKVQKRSGCATLDEFKESLAICEKSFPLAIRKKRREFHPRAAKHWGFICSSENLVLDLDALKRVISLSTMLISDPSNLADSLDHGYDIENWSATIRSMDSDELRQLQGFLLDHEKDMEEDLHLLYRMCFDLYCEAGFMEIDGRAVIKDFASLYVMLALEGQLSFDDGEDVNIELGDRDLSATARSAIVEIVMNDLPDFTTDQRAAKKHEVVRRLYGWTGDENLGPFANLSHKAILAIADIVDLDAHK